MKKAVTLIGGLALVIAVASGTAPASPGTSWSTQSLVTDATHITAGRNGQDVELDLKGTALSVARLPDSGFFGLSVGDVIVKVDGQGIRTTDEFLAALQKSAETATFTIARGDKRLELRVPRHAGFDRFI